MSGPRLTLGGRAAETLITALGLAAAAAMFVRSGGGARSFLPSATVLAAVVILSLIAGAAVRSRAALVAFAEGDWRSRLRPYAFVAGLAAVVALSLLVRLPALGTDLGHFPLDIDEHRLAANVRNYFATGELVHATVEHYPGVVFWMLAASSLVAYLSALMHGTIRGLGDMPVETFVYAGRFTNALIAAATVAVTGLIGRRLSRPSAGLLAAGMVAIVPLSVQTTTALRNDAGQVLFVMAAVYAALMAYFSDGRRWTVAAGLLAGCAAAIKYTSVFVLIPALLAPSLRGPARLRASRVGATLLAFAIALATTNHFLWSDFPTFVRQLSYQVTVTGADHWASSGNPAAVHVMFLTRFGPGWPMLLLAAGCGAYGLARGGAAPWIFWTFPLLYSWFTTQRPSQFGRWVYPLVPFVAVAGSAGLVSVVARLSAWRGRFHGRAWSTLVAVSACAVVAGVLWQPVWAGTVEFSRRVTPRTHAIVETWLRDHAAGQVVLSQDGWLDLRGSGVRVRRVPDLAALLGSGLYGLCTSDLIVVPEIYFGNPGLRRLIFVRRFSADQRSFGGNMGYDYEIYAAPKLPPLAGGDVRLDQPEAAPFLGPEWRPDESGKPGLQLPRQGASLFLPPAAHDATHVAIEISEKDPPGENLPVKLEAGDSEVALVGVAASDRGTMRLEGVARIAQPGRATQLRLKPAGTNTVRVLRLHFE